MKNFTYIQPENLKDAAKQLGNNWKDRLLIAGGTDLLGLMKHNLEKPDVLINLKSISGLEKIEYLPGKELRIGALTKITDIAEHPVIREKFTALAEAAGQVASPQLRNMGTIGGNICQRPRCWYYRGDFNCLRKGGDICFAVEGRNKFHCIIGGAPCFIVHPSDLAVALQTLEAKLIILSGKKTKSVAIKDFFVLPDVDVYRENILQPGEIVTEIHIPEPATGSQSGYLKFQEREVWDFATVSVGVSIK
ncbi:MAG: FAD binding domain-containing protein [bacterium]|nr:FAD binding domain-containing protein [bacterium]